MTARSDPNWRPCSDCALERGDNLEGTGSRGLQWFLIELSGSWGHSAFVNSPSAIDPTLGREIVRRIERAGMRPLAIRRTGRRAETDVWRWAFVDSRPGHETIRWGRVDTPRDLLDVPLDGSTGTPSTDPLVVVCTHGRHDQCCAVHGRRAAQALDATHPDQMWECSHLGGDRFAATMVMFPHGFYFGRADLTDTSELFHQYTQGTVDTRFVRGRSSLSNPVQAAQHHARLMLQDNRIDTLAPLSESVDDDVWTIVLEHDGGSDVTVTLEQGWSTPILSTCDATIPGPVRTFTLRSIER
jgi:hypothetical protein